MDALLLRFDAPLQSFGDVLVDQNGPTLPFPGRALLTGLLANALGWQHGDFELHQSLQARLTYAVRQDREGELLQDYQSVDLGQDHMSEGGWTTRGVRSRRAGGNSGGTHLRFRDYHADAVYTLAVTLAPLDESPTLEDLARALDSPARPLFLGRKACLPSSRLMIGRTRAESLLEALARAPRLPNSRERLQLPAANTARAFWPESDPSQKPGTRVWPVFDERDWANQVHTGRRFVREGPIVLAPRVSTAEPSVPT